MRTAPLEARTRPCLRCLGTGRVHGVDGGALGQQRGHAPQPVACPECRGSRVIEVRSR